MKSLKSCLRKFARRLVAHAVNVLPGDRSEWAQAMRHELDHIPNSITALRWALGCVFACYLERMTVMKTGDFRISRVVLSLEMLMCFGPTSFGFFALFWPGVWLIPAFGWLLFLFSIQLVGPIGLILAFRLIVLEHTSMGKFVMAALCLPAAWTFIGFSIFTLIVSHPGDLWQGFILLAILPVLGAVHLVYMSNPEEKILTAV